MVLRVYAAINNNKPKNFYTKPITVKPTKRSAANNAADGTENDQNKMNTDPEPVETTRPDDTVAEPV